MTGPRIGFVGLGDMGAPMARRIVDAGYPMAVWARRVASLAPFADVERAGELPELARGRDVICVCVFGDADVEQVVSSRDGLLAGAAAGTLVVIHSTITVRTFRRVAADARTRGVTVVDAPVSGGRRRAIEGTLDTLVGGDPDTVAGLRPVFESFSARIHYLGGPGAGLVGKALNNALFYANLHLATTAIEVGVALGLDQGSIQECLSTTTANSGALALMLDRLARGDEAEHEHVRRTAAKDLKIFAQLRGAAGLPATDIERLVGRNPGHVVPMIDQPTGEGVDRT